MKFTGIERFVIVLIVFVGTSTVLCWLLFARGVGILWEKHVEGKKPAYSLIVPAQGTAVKPEDQKLFGRYDGPKELYHINAKGEWCLPDGTCSSEAQFKACIGSYAAKSQMAVMEVAMKGKERKPFVAKTPDDLCALCPNIEEISIRCVPVGEVK